MADNKDTKTCYACLAVKAFEDFAPDGHGRRLNMCRACRSTYCNRKKQERSRVRGGLKMDLVETEIAFREMKDWIAERLLAHREISESGCWLWKARKDKHGYGKLFVNHKGKRTELFVHRLSLALSSDFDIADRATQALHKCDNPQCFNPEHLFAGTQADNLRDCADKGRKATLPIISGEACSFARLSAEQVRAIRLEYDSGASRIEMATKYGVSTQSIFRIGKRRSWCNLQ